MGAGAYKNIEEQSYKFFYISLGQYILRRLVIYYTTLHQDPNHSWSHHRETITTFPIWNPCESVTRNDLDLDASCLESNHMHHVHCHDILGFIEFIHECLKHWQVSGFFESLRDNDIYKRIHVLDHHDITDEMVFSLLFFKTGELLKRCSIVGSLSVSFLSDSSAILDSPYLIIEISKQISSSIRRGARVSFFYCAHSI
jgi:hypothetical protein